MLFVFFVNFFLNYFLKFGLFENCLIFGFEEFLIIYYFVFFVEVEVYYREFIYSVNFFFKSYLFFFKCSIVSV